MPATDRQPYPYRLTVTNNETGDTTDRPISSACAMRALELVSRDHAALPLLDGEYLEHVAGILEARADRTSARAREVPDGEASRDTMLAAARWRIAAGVLRDMSLADTPEAWADAHRDAEVPQ